MATRHSYLEVVNDAAALLGAQIRDGRARRGWTVRELADRAQLSTKTLLKAEHGDPTVALGTALQLAALVGVPLFGGDERQLAIEARAARTLLNRRVRRATEPDADLDF
ncbi:MAG: helix-turn-helix domain-containing protein [Solirubrobacteraceae bacterium]